MVLRIWLLTVNACSHPSAGLWATCGPRIPSQGFVLIVQDSPGAPATSRPSTLLQWGGWHPAMRLQTHRRSDMPGRSSQVPSQGCPAAGVQDHPWRDSAKCRRTCQISPTALSPKVDHLKAPRRETPHRNSRREVCGPTPRAVAKCQRPSSRNRSHRNDPPPHGRRRWPSRADARLSGLAPPGYDDPKNSDRRLPVLTCRTARTSSRCTRVLPVMQMTNRHRLGRGRQDGPPSSSHPTRRARAASPNTCPSRASARLIPAAIAMSGSFWMRSPRVERTFRTRPGAGPRHRRPHPWAD